MGKLSGAVGTYAHLDPAIEKGVCDRLGLTPAPVASQVVQRDRHAELLSTLAITAGLAREVRPGGARSAEDRGRRSGRALRQGAEGVLGDAAQAQPDRLRAGHGAGAAGAHQCAGGDRERGAVARARHLALVRRARHRARQLLRARSHGSQVHAHPARPGRLPGANARESGTLARRRLLWHGAPGDGQRRRLARGRVSARAAQRHALARRGTRFQGAVAGGSRRNRGAWPGRDRARLRPGRATPARGCDHGPGVSHGVGRMRRRRQRTWAGRSRCGRCREGEGLRHAEALDPGSPGQDHRQRAANPRLRFRP